MRLLLLFSLLVNLFLHSSCKKYQPADSSFFIKSETVSVSTNTSEQGTGSHKITDLWLYVNGKYAGVYPTGNLMPIANKDKATRINIFAGIKNNGIADTRITYPFFDFLSIDTLVEAGKTISRPFTFKYKASTTFAWLEDFETSSGFSIVNKGDSKSETITSAEGSFEGKSLKLSLPDTGYALGRIESFGDGFTLPSGSGNVYLELNYKSNTVFSVGLLSSDGSQYASALLINPQENWNKIYVQLSKAVSTIVANKYKVYIEFLKGANETNTKEVFLDNIKLIYL